MGIHPPPLPYTHTPHPRVHAKVVTWPPPGAEYSRIHGSTAPHVSSGARRLLQARVSRAVREDADDEHP